MTKTETQAQPFFRHEIYVPTYYVLYIALEEWLANKIFRQDLSRIFLASDEYAFRRRFELTDTSSDYSTITVSSLKFPFGNYWPSNDGWRPDDRVAANTAALIVEGIPHRTRMLRAMAVTTSINGTFYFNREDDARLAYETLLWLSYREQYLATTIGWKDETLNIPLNIKIQDLLFNPDFKEKDWLTQNRIFTVKANFELRSYSLKPVEQPKYATSIIPEDNEKFYLTEEVVFKLLTSKKLLGEISIDSLFNQNPSIIVNQFGVISTTPNSARIGWNVSVDSDTDELSFIQLTLSGREPITLEPTRVDYTFRKLVENSSYYVTIKFITAKGLSKELATQFTTPLSPQTTVHVKAEPNTLVGITW